MDAFAGRRLPGNQGMTHGCIALLDDSSATAATPGSRLHTGHVRTLACHRPQDFNPMLEQMQQALQDGLHAVGLFSYELAAQFQGALARATTQPLAQVLLFERCERLSATQVDAWLARRAAECALSSVPDAPEAQCAGVAAVRAGTDAAAFFEAIAQIHAYLEAGDTYQVNYTYRLQFCTYGPLLALYRKLRARQPVPYGALIVLPDGASVLSFSPELFLRNTDGHLTARPMKGTAAVSGDPVLDRQRAAALALDAKNRAENLMIVDLLRNDLGRIATLGSVRVPQLFEVNAFGNVLQMTSTIEAELQPELTLAALFAALYPCGSITGAPKHRTMQIIDQIEPAARGLYTGAIGWFEQARGMQRIGDFCLSVPIRTLVLDPPQADGTRPGQMGVGAGIVYDSNAADEFDECLLKASFLTAAPTDFGLFETMYATRREGYRHLERHLLRLQASARHFGFAHDDSAIRAALESTRAQLPDLLPCRVRLDLGQDGGCTTQGAPLAPLPPVVRLLLAAAPVDIGSMLLQHKISVRSTYDLAWRAAETQGAFDMLFRNTEGELTEGARSSLFLMLDGRWYTPPLAAGVLPGIMRGVLLDDPHWQATERRLTLADLQAADKIVLCNALRGVMPAQVVWPQI